MCLAACVRHSSGDETRPSSSGRERDHSYAKGILAGWPQPRGFSRFWLGGLGSLGLELWRKALGQPCSTLEADHAEALHGADEVVFGAQHSELLTGASGAIPARARGCEGS